MERPWLTDVAKGEWWLPDAPDNRVPGIVLEKEGRFRLELIGSFEDWGRSLETKRYDTIYGHLTRGGPVVLVNCVGSGSFSAPGMVTQHCDFRFAIKGEHFNASTNQFFRLSGECPSLLVWMDRSSIEINLDWCVAEGARNSINWHASYRPLPPVIIRWGSGVEIKIDVYPEKLPSREYLGRPISIRQICNVSVSSESAKSIFELERILYEFELFLRLISGFPRSLRLISCQSNPKDKDQRPFEVVSNQRFGRKIEVDVSPSDPIVRYEDVEQYLQCLIDNWRKFLGCQENVVGFYISGRETRAAEDQFVTAANTLQRLVESHGKRQSFQEAIRRGLCDYVSEDRLKEVAALIAETRHYYTHMNPSKSESAAIGAELLNLTDLLDAAIVCNLLQMLGFEASRVDDLISQNQKIRDKLEMKRWREI